MPGMEVSTLFIPKLLSPIFCFFSFLFLITNPISVAAATTSFENLKFSLTNFDSNGNNIDYEGNAIASNGAIQLTSSQRDMLPSNGSVGRATYKDPFHLWENSQKNLADFTTHFSFSIDAQKQNMYGNGFAFFLVPNGSKLPAYSGDGNLGLMTNQSDPDFLKANFLAIEFDTVENSWDPPGNHIGIDLNSVISLNTTYWWWSHIQDGGRAQAQISYNSSSQNLTVLLLDERDPGGFPTNSSSVSYKIDLREHLPEWVTVGFSGSSGPLFELHTINSWNFSSRLRVIGSSPAAAIPPKPQPTKTINMKLIGAILGTVLSILSVCLGFVLFWFWMKRKSRKKGERKDQKEDFENKTRPRMDQEEDFEETGPRKIPYKDLLAATDNFNDELGKGGFGIVYKGSLKDSEVAVKRITPDNLQQGLKEFESEVKTIRKLRHINIVELVGWCCENQECLIVYKFMINKSLYFHLFEENNLLRWDFRYKIATGLARALHYLQEEQDTYILHRDIKSSNVLLDVEFNAKLSDFGLAKLVNHGQPTEKLIGTRGYVAPEYLGNSVATKESDIYSFGVVCLEIACGKAAFREVIENVKKSNLVDWVREHKQRGNVMEAADPKLQENFKKGEMERLLLTGLACTQPAASRPSIKRVIYMLDPKAPLPDLSSQNTGSTNSTVFLSANMEMLPQQSQTQFSGQSHSSKASTSTF